MTTAIQTTSATYQVVSVPPTKVADTDHVVEWSRRSTTANPVDNAQRYRGVIVPAASLAVPMDACTSKFHRLLQNTVHGLADKAFQAYINDRMNDITLPTGALSLDAVLAYWAEEKQRQTIDADKINEWFKTCATIAALDAGKQKAWKNKVPKIAAPSYKMGFTKTQAASIVSQLHADDLQHPVAIFIATRCNAILTAETEEEAL